MDSRGRDGSGQGPGTGGGVAFLLGALLVGSGLVAGACATSKPVRRTCAGKKKGAMGVMAKASMNEKKTVVELPERSSIEDRYKWDPSVIFPNKKAWEREKQALRKDIPTLESCRGKLGRSPKELKNCLDRVFAVMKRLEYLDAYASRLLDTDIRQSGPQAMVADAEKLYADFKAATAYMDPELLSLPEDELRKLASNRLLADYDRYLLKLIRLKKHVLSHPEESILAQTTPLAYSAYHIYKTFANAEMEFPVFTDHEGRTVRLSQAMYAKYRKSPYRAERKEVFEKFWRTFGKYRGTFSQMLTSQVKYYEFKAKVRRYKNALSASLVPNAIPPEFYPKLIHNVTAHLDSFHRYLQVRKKLLGIEGDQYYYDIYPLGAEGSQRKYSFDEARATVKAALRPLGRAYGKKLSAALADGSGWLDVYPNKGKRSGAYSSSVYGAHPLVLLNYTGDFNSMSTLAHELGHAIHSAFSDEAQPYPKSDYALFNAEVASIFNETLLIEYLLHKEKNPAQRRFLLAAYLDSFRGTVFRQTMFAEFEWEVYKRTEARKPVTADALDRLYLKLLRKYHGHSKGIMKIQPIYAAEWAYIPHFYYNFYVYQYVSGFIAATALAHRVLTEGNVAARRYIDKMLKAGSSADPLDILKNAGVDMLSSQPYDLAAKIFDQRVAELAKLANSAH